MVLPPNTKPRCRTRIPTLCRWCYGTDVHSHVTASHERCPPCLEVRQPTAECRPQEADGKPEARRWRTAVESSGRGSL
jgi:hypothetical protein